MTTSVGSSAYLDVPAYLRAATNHETASLLGLATTIGGSSTVAAGTTSLPVASSTGWASGPLWLLDGPSSEVCQVIASADGTHVTLAAPGTQFDHVPGVSASQGGASGALAETILRASAWIENYCRQGSGATDRSLFAIPRSERWGMPSLRAYLDRDGVLVIRPGHFPIQSIASVAVELGQGQSVTLDATQAELPSSGRLIELPHRLWSTPSPGQLLVLENGLSRGRRQWVTLTYTAGLTPSAVPYDIQLACVWVTSELLAERRNPTGAASMRQGKFQLDARLRGDTSGDSILLLQAKHALDPYRDLAI